MTARRWVGVGVLAACTGGGVREPPAADDSASVDSAEPACALGLPCRPIPVDAFPYTDARDTAAAPASAFDVWPCAPDTNEGGPEWWYAVTIPSRGVLAVSVRDGAGVDADVHVLTGLDPASCVTRDDTDAAWPVAAGTVHVVVDTWVDGDGVPQTGAYTLSMEFRDLATGPCRTRDADLRMYWSECAPGIDCYRADQGGTEYSFLRTPAWGPVVGEAHLVTTGETFPGDGWPTSLRDQIDRHYTVTQAASGYVMDRDEPWAPEGEGGSHWGGGATGAKVPPLEETFYVNMYWRDRPAKGTRMLVLDPFSGRAVVAAGGYETGPGSHTAIGGASEEIHHHLGTTHRDPAVMGFTVDETLAYGPIACW